ncbi:MAG: 50S ribosomal protein L11 methyltransferase [Ignavibacteriaceae bacterium]
MKQYKEFEIKTTPFNPDILSGFLWELDISGINEEDDVLKIFTDENSSVTKEEIVIQLKKLIENNIIKSYDIIEQNHEYKNWNEEWEKGLNIIEVSDHVVIKPSFKNYKNEKGKTVITIDPKMSFGTGEHQTTKLMIQLMEKYLERDMKVLDIGTGTGILSIAAVKLGAAYAVAIDNDEWCLENIQENCRLNNVSDRIDIKISEIESVQEKGFDLILANIQKNVLVNIEGQIVKRLEKNGLVILSGLLNEDEKDIMEKYNGLNLIDKRLMGEWLALVLRK